MNDTTVRRPLALLGKCVGEGATGVDSVRYESGNVINQMSQEVRS